MRVLLTGNKGFIGAQIENGLKSAQIDYKGMDKGDPIPEDRFDIILHFGARTLIRESAKYPYRYFEDNLDFTLRLLEKCRSDSTSIVFPTSGSVQEATNPYSLSKKQGEEWINLYHLIYGVNAYVLKLFNIYGETSQKGAVYLFCHAALNDKPVIIYGDGSHKRDFLYVGDLVRFVLEIVSGKVHPGNYQVGTGIPTSVKDLLSIVERISGRKLKVESDRHFSNNLKVKSRLSSKYL